MKVAQIAVALTLLIISSPQMVMAEPSKEQVKLGKQIATSVKKLNKALLELDLALTKTPVETYERVNIEQPGVLRMIGVAQAVLIQSNGLLDASASLVGGTETQTSFGEIVKQRFVRDRAAKQLKIKQREEAPNL